jgi:hypothetical protein
MSELPSWKAQDDSQSLEALVQGAGPDGLTRGQLREAAHMGEKRFVEALGLFRASRFVDETKERRPDRRGNDREQVVFRHRAPNPHGVAPARVSRDPAT